MLLPAFDFSADTGRANACETPSLQQFCAHASLEICGAIPQSPPIWLDGICAADIWLIWAGLIAMPQSGAQPLPAGTPVAHGSPARAG
jgi:hypothetical protein